MVCLYVIGELLIEKHRDTSRSQNIWRPLEISDFPQSGKCAWLLTSRATQTKCHWNEWDMYSSRQKTTAYVRNRFHILVCIYIPFDLPVASRHVRLINSLLYLYS